MSAVEDESLFCAHCGYNLRGVESARCPECGEAFERGAMPRSHLAWVHRRKLGSASAFFSTTWTALAHPRRLAAEMQLPVDMEAAVQYRRMMVVLNVVPALGGVAGLYLWGWLFEGKWSVGAWAHTDWSVAFTYAPEPWSVLALLAAFALFMVLASGAHLYFFHAEGKSPEMERRAVALAHYACAPLIAFWPMMVLVVVTMGVDVMVERYHLPPMVTEVFALVTLSAVPVVVLLRVWTLPLSLLAYALKAGWVRVGICAVVLPVLWGVCAGVALLVPLGLVFGELVRQSFLR